MCLASGPIARLPLPADAQPELRQKLVEVARRMNSSGINQGTSGNLSARIPGGLLITPTSLPYEQMEPEDLVAIDFGGHPTGHPKGHHSSPRRPSSEWQLHAEILRSRPEIEAVLHCHSIHATALACHGRPIPSFHYMVAMAGTATIPCAPYSTFGTKALSLDAVRALEGKLACLLAQHGQVALGRNLDQALRLAIEVETLAHMYLQALSLGEPPLLDAAEMERVIALMGSMHYGQAADRPGQS
ncbi:class II aldolase/adducin family protein [Cyanobium sp. HWJ4-Hawea]|nr:class II aldolase/adducin family protein [Cyanobium sp. HWJ4-Hawea]